MAAYWGGFARASALRTAGSRLHSRPSHHGGYMLLSLVLPVLAIVALAWLLGVTGITAVPEWLVLTAAVPLGLANAARAFRGIRAELRARNAVERVVQIALFVAATVSIMTTVGIVASILFESIRFFEIVSPIDFVTGTEWAPETAFYQGTARDVAAAEPKFGAVPLFAGTFLITLIALAVAVPVGLLSAVYMAEYASYRARGIFKPALEILAGIPTVVYGFFAAITVAPIVVDLAGMLGLEASFENALAPGLVMGIMIIPFVSSLSDDVINAVPQSLREGSLALGTTHAETIKKVVLPAAMPGIVSAVLLAISRALGETMIVVMAAGLRPNLTWNPLEGMTTVTVRIVSSLVGDKSFDSPETLSAFALGLILFIVTLVLNVVATIVIRRFRQKYEF